MIRLKRIATSTYFITVILAEFIFCLFIAMDEVHRGAPDAGLLLVVLPVLIPVFGAVHAIFGYLPFLLLKSIAPANPVLRFIFVAMIVFPLVGSIAIIGGLLIDGLSDYSPYFPSPKPPAITRFIKLVSENGNLVAAAAALVGGICLCLEYYARLFSKDISVKRKARVYLAVPILIVALVITLFFNFNQLYVVHRAKAIAGERPYCVLVPRSDNNHVRLYVAVSRISELAPARMQAIYALVSGSRGGMYATNHAVLVLDNPREYLNWSYRSANFVDNALINYDLRLSACAPTTHFVDTLQ